MSGTLAMGSLALTHHYRSTLPGIGNMVSTDRRKEQRSREDNTTHCSPIFCNSAAWLAGPRLPNSDEEGTADLLRELVDGAAPRDANAGAARVLAQQALCREGSRFRRWDGNATAEATGESLPFLANRLMYLALHEHQHRPARAEARARSGGPPCAGAEGAAAAVPKLEGVGRFDFECDPSTKYLVARVSTSNGLGMVLRDSAVEPFFFGLLTDRVVLWDNLKRSFHASCARRDLQCLFLPLSPCVLTREAVENATKLSKADVRALRREGALPEKYAGDRVIRLRSDNHVEEPKGTRAAIVRSIEALYAGERGATARPWDLDDAALRRVCDYILDGTFDLDRRWLIWKAPLLYMLRPNFRLRETLDASLRRSLPADFDGVKAIGLPIRGMRWHGGWRPSPRPGSRSHPRLHALTFARALVRLCSRSHSRPPFSFRGALTPAGDKCKREQECYGFETYMQVAEEMVPKRYRQTSGTYDTIVLTSETREMIEARANYTRNETWRLRFVVNANDTFQGHGHPELYQTENFTADDVMISTLMALQMQLLPGTLVLNTCSNFHKMIDSFYSSGCANVSRPYAEWLQKNDNPLLRMQCNM